MINKLKTANRLNEVVFMGVLSLFCFSFSVTRCIYSDTKTFLFLNWNLFLAFIPWVLTTWLITYPKIQKNKIVVGLTIGMWLLFFPALLIKYIFVSLRKKRYEMSKMFI